MDGYDFLCVYQNCANCFMDAIQRLVFWVSLGFEALSIPSKPHPPLFAHTHAHSATAMKKYSGGVAEYRASEGKCVEVPYRGPVDATICEILGGVRSTCTYVGAATLKELTKRTTFIRCTAQHNPTFDRLKRKDKPPGLRTRSGESSKKPKLES